MDSLEKQLADLEMIQNGFGTVGKIKKIPPAVPPKKKAQPQVPHSATVNTLREPSYSTRIPAEVINSNRQAYYEANRRQASVSVKDYVNVKRTPVSSMAHNTGHRSIPSHRNVADELPPPPPPPPPLNYKYDTLQNVEEYLPAPPSPVSSNYSELARATANLNNNLNEEQTCYPPIYQNEYPTYGASQASTYESLYEPINPRPQSCDSLENTKLTPHNTAPSHKLPIMKKTLSQNEAEVDSLTNLLVKSISHSQDTDVFGICRRCNGKVVGDSSGCTAMGFVYHVECFCCFHCNNNLQGKPFYSVEGQPYCEIDYYATLEKCCVCSKPILDRILRATGKPYHPSCFTCVVCGKSLDGIPFTVDALNQIHCIEDFHKKFAPRCCVCELPIMPEEGEEETVRVVALDRSFHVRCYRCEDCGLQLSSESEGRGCYPLDDHILCKECNAHRVRQLTNVMTTDL